MPRHLRRSRSAARPSSENGGSSTALSPTAWRRQGNACSPSLACRRANGAVCEPQMQSSVCTRNSSAGSRPKPFCRQPTLLRFCSGRYSHQDRSTCERWMAGRRSPQNPSINRLTLPPETIPSCYWRMRHTEFQPHFGRHNHGPGGGLRNCGSNWQDGAYLQGEGIFVYVLSISENLGVCLLAPSPSIGAG